MVRIESSIAKKFLDECKKEYSIEYQQLEDTFIIKYKDIEFEFTPQFEGYILKKIIVKSISKDKAHLLDNYYPYYYVKNPIKCEININYFVQIIKEIDLIM